MNRREFFKVVSAAGVIAALPTQLFASQPIDVASAVRWFETNFKCSMGAPWAFVEPRPQAYEDYVYDPAWWALDESRDYKGLTPYNTYVITASNERIAVAELLSLFGEAIERHPSIAGSLLYWRLDDKVHVKNISRRVGGDLVFTQEQVENDPALWYECEKEGVEHNDEDGCYYRNRRDENFVVLRTRIAVPEMQRLGEQDARMHSGWDVFKPTEDV